MNDLDLAPGERIVGATKRNLFPHWAVLAVLGMALMVYSVGDPLFGWGKFLIGVVLLAFLGSILSSTRLVVTDRRAIRTGWLGRKEIAKPRLRTEPGAFGDTLIVTGQGLGPGRGQGDAARITVRFVKNAQEFASSQAPAQARARAP